MKQHTSTSVHFFYLAISGVLFTTSVIEAQHAAMKKDKIILCTFFTPSHEDMANKWLLPSIQDDFEIIIGTGPQECKSGSFMQDGWIETTRKKVLHIIDTIENNMGHTMIFADPDIQLFGPVGPHITKLLKNNDIVIQRDNPSGTFCTGFFAHRCNEQMADFWKQVNRYMLNNYPHKCDQRAFNEVVHKTQIKSAYLPSNFFMGAGTLSGKKWNPGDKLEIPNDILMFHANYTAGLEKKEQLLKYVHDVVKQRSIIKIPKNIYVPDCMRRGKLRSISGPYITGDAFRAYCDHIVDTSKDYFDASAVLTGDLIYVYPVLLQFFFSKVHPHIKAPYILITQNALHTVPIDHQRPAHFKSGDFSKYLDDDKLIAWFGKNAIGNNPKLFTIPIGLLNAAHECGNVKTIERVRNTQYEKKYLLSGRFKINTNKALRDPVAKLFSKKPFCHMIHHHQNFSDYLTTMAQSKFILSPQGYGTDSHRTWEALAVGTIPIVPSTPIDHIYDDLPVIIVNDWNEVTEEFLHKKYEEFKQRTFNLEKMYMPYWIEKIEKVKEKIY